MKFTRRHLVNLILVGVIGVVSIAWAAVGLAGIRFDKPKTITVDLAQTGMGQGLSGLVGHEDDIRNGLAAWGQIGDTLAQHHAELGDLISASAKLTSALDANRDQLSGAISGYAALGQTLSKHTGELE